MTDSYKIPLAQEILEEIASAEPSQMYVTLKTKIAGIEEELNTNIGYFWKRPKHSITSTAQLEATRDVLLLALMSVTLELGL